MEDLDLFVSSVPATLRGAVRRVAEEAQLDPSELRRQVQDYLREVHRVAEASALVDTDLCDAIGASCLALLDALPALGAPRDRHLVQVACRYFVRTDDETPDLDEVLGFDDDAEVLNRVADAIGRPDLRVAF